MDIKKITVSPMHAKMTESLLLASNTDRVCRHGHPQHPKCCGFDANHDEWWSNIYDPVYDEFTSEALSDCARVCQVAIQYKEKFEKFLSPLLVLRVAQVTLYLCTLLYAATEKFDMVTVEYLAAVALDIFVYCYFGNQIIVQADRVSTAAYQCSWYTMGPRPRRLLLNIMLANRRPVVVRAGRFLPMDLRTFVVIIKTSFSYYTLLVNVNEK